MKLTTNNVANSIHTSWLVALKSETHSETLHNWNTVMKEIDGMQNMINYCEGTDKAAKELAFLWAVAFEHCYTA